MGKGDDFAGVGVAVKRGRGRPRSENSEWTIWARRVAEAVTRYGRASAYLADGKFVVRSAHSQFLVPANAILVGRYEAPFVYKAFYWDMQRLPAKPLHAKAVQIGADVYFPQRSAMVAKIRSFLSMTQRPVDVHIVRESLAMYLRVKPQGRKPNRLPAQAEYLGRYETPFSARDFCDDLAAHLATVPQQVAA